MNFLKRVAGAIGFILFLTPCVIAGIYAADHNTAKTLAGWGVGLGVALVEGSIISFLVNKKSQKTLMLAVLGILVGALPSYYWIAKPRMALQPFNAHLAEYVATASTTGTSEDYERNYMPVKGKLIALDMKAKTIDPVFFDLSDTFRPKKPEEIGTIAALWWEERRIGSYGGKGGAYQMHCSVVILDKSTGAVLGQKSFVGSDPPSTSRNGVSQTGDKPYKEIREYLNSLPHT